MGFFLVGRSREDGSLNLISDSEYDSRASAVDALSTLEVDASLESEVYVVNLEDATPVLLVQRSAIASAEDASEPEVAAQPEPVVEPEPAVEAAAEADSESEPEPLADVLRRATGSLESEGIVAPENVGPPEPEPAPELAPETAPDPAPETAPDPAPETAPEPAAESTSEPEPAPATDEEAGWPWDAADKAAEEAYVPDPLEEPAVDSDDELVHARGDDATLELSRTVVMGAYSEEAAVPEVTPAHPAAEPEELAAAPAPAPESVAEVAAELAPEPARDEAVDSLIADLEIEPDESSIPEEPKEYQAGEVDMTDLSCGDCVYVNTCPNKDERDPASCGSFQWKSS